MPESMRDKALRAIAEDRVRIVRATAQGIALDVLASRPDTLTLLRATYRVLVYVRADEIVRECSCPAPRRCYHLQIAELLWRPGTDEVSDR